MDYELARYKFIRVLKQSKGSVLLNVPVTEILRFNILGFFNSSLVIIFVILKVKEEYNILRYLDSHTTPPSSKYAHTKPLGGTG